VESVGIKQAKQQTTKQGKEQRRRGGSLHTAQKIKAD